MDERTAGRLELTATRAQALLGPGTSAAGVPATGAPTAMEGAESGPRGPGADDVPLIARRIGEYSTIKADGAVAIAMEIVDRAGKALEKLAQGATNAEVSETDAQALESVMMVRGRPALRVLANHLESLDSHPGSEFWQEIISEYEKQIVAAANATGAAIVSSFDSGNPPWAQGSAWLVAPDRVVTNRHVLQSDEIKLLEVTEDGQAVRLRAGNTIRIEFAADSRVPGVRISRSVTRVLYVASPGDPVDIAVLEIEPYADQSPLKLAAGTASLPNNLFVIGHPGLMAEVPDAIQAVFGKPDGQKRVSFGKRLKGVIRDGVFAYDASTIGGYSGGPVVEMSHGSVAGLHYYGDPIVGNLAFTSHAIRKHLAYRHMVKADS